MSALTSDVESTTRRRRQHAQEVARLTSLGLVVSQPPTRKRPRDDDVDNPLQHLVCSMPWS
jgi:hypothetical protein